MKSITFLLSLIISHFVFATSFRDLSLYFMKRNWISVHPRHFTLQTQSSSGDYSANAITVLQGLEPVRKRPGMYIGSTGSKGLHHLVYEVVDNSVDEALAGFCNKISVVLMKNGQVEVKDNGRGIPCDIHPVTNKSSLETVLCVLHAGGKFGGDSSGYKVSGGLHGVGISVVNALSEIMCVEVVRGETVYTMSFSRGIPVCSLQQRKATSDDENGTRVTFLPDEEIFKTTQEFDFEKLSSRLEELAYLNAGLLMTLTDERNVSTPVLRSFLHKGGISELVETLCREKQNLCPGAPVISFREERDNVTVEVAMQWSSDQFDDVIFGFANGIRTSDGGTHLDGLKSSLSRTVNQFAKKVSPMRTVFAFGNFFHRLGRAKKVPSLENLSERV